MIKSFVALAPFSCDLQFLFVPVLSLFPFGKSKKTGVWLVCLFQCRQKRHSLNVLSWQHHIAAVQSHYIWIGRPCELGVMTLHTGFPINSGLTTVITFCPSLTAVKQIFFLSKTCHRLFFFFSWYCVLKHSFHCPQLMVHFKICLQNNRGSSFSSNDAYFEW